MLCTNADYETEKEIYRETHEGVRVKHTGPVTLA